MKFCNVRNAAMSFALALLVAGCGGGNGSSCTTSDSCAENQFCKFTSGCTGSGTCVDVNQTCSNEIAPVCSCDNLTFFNECWADAAAQSVSSQGECP